MPVRLLLWPVNIHLMSKRCLALCVYVCTACTSHGYYSGSSSTPARTNCLAPFSSQLCKYASTLSVNQTRVLGPVFSGFGKFSRNRLKSVDLDQPVISSTSRIVRVGFWRIGYLSLPDRTFSMSSECELKVPIGFFIALSNINIFPKLLQPKSIATTYLQFDFWNFSACMKD